MTVTANLNESLDTEVVPKDKAVREIAFEVAPEGELTLTFRPSLVDSVKFTVR